MADLPTPDDRPPDPDASGNPGDSTGDKDSADNADSPEAAHTGRHVLAQGPRKEEILEYSLLLASQGIRHWFEFDGDAYVLSVDPDAAAVAAAQLQLYVAENRGFQDPPLTAAPLDLRLAPLVFLALPAGMYFWVGLQPWANWLHERGLADAARLRAGEWWRAITATTLHADDAHLLSNLVSGYFILNLLNHKMGMGTVMLLSTLAAGAANYLVAFTSGAQHYSLGFSSVVFSALGLLAAVETLTRPRRAEKKLRTLTPLLSAFFVAVMVGIGEGVDVKAHFFGFGCGVLLGALSMAPKAKGLGQGIVRQIALGLGSLGLYGLAWFLALTRN